MLHFFFLSTFEKHVFLCLFSINLFWTTRRFGGLFLCSPWKIFCLSFAKHKTKMIPITNLENNESNDARCFLSWFHSLFLFPDLETKKNFPLNTRLYSLEIITIAVVVKRVRVPVILVFVCVLGSSMFAPFEPSSPHTSPLNHSILPLPKKTRWFFVFVPSSSSLPCLHRFYLRWTNTPTIQPTNSITKHKTRPKCKL